MIAVVENPPSRRPALSAARWHARTQVTPADVEVARACQITPVTAAILRGRGFSTAEQVCGFFEPSIDALHDPFTLPDIAPAVERLHRAITEREAIWVFGDYDVDGVTSAALLTRALRALAEQHPHGRHDVGVERILWSSDYPHPPSTWPNSLDSIDEQFAGIPDHERRLMICDNAARVWGL